MFESRLFTRAQKRSRKWGETNDCTVIALAIATGNPYEVAHGALALRGRSFRKGVAMYQVFQALEDLGFDREKVFERWTLDHGTEFTESSPSHQAAKRYRRSRWANVKTVRTLPEHLPKRGVFLIETASHVFCARAGEVHDWTEGRKHRITNIHRIIRRSKD